MFENLWDYFGQFDDREAFRVFVILCFAFGLPLVIGLWCKIVIWSTRQCRLCQQYLSTSSNDLPELQASH